MQDVSFLRPRRHPRHGSDVPHRRRSAASDAARPDHAVRSASRGTRRADEEEGRGRSRGSAAAGQRRHQVRRRQSVPDAASLLDDVYATGSRNRHGTSTSKTNTGVRKLPYVGAITEGVREVLLEQDNAFVAGEDVGRPAASTGTTAALQGIRRRPRHRHADFRERHHRTRRRRRATGLRPIVDIMFMDFMGECMDEIANQMAKMRSCSAAARRCRSRC